MKESKIFKKTILENCKKLIQKVKKFKKDLFMVNNIHGNYYT